MAITEQPILALVNRVDASATVVSSNSEASSALGAANLAEDDLARRIYRSAGLATPTPFVKVNFGAAAAFQLVAFDYVNWREATTVLVPAGIADLTGKPRKNLTLAISVRSSRPKATRVISLPLAASAGGRTKRQAIGGVASITNGLLTVTSALPALLRSVASQ